MPVRSAGTWLLSLALTLAGAAPALADRLALVIGNGAQADQPAVPTAAADARAMDAALRDAGYRVTLLTDAGSADLRRTLAQLAPDAAAAEAMVVYFGGLAVQLDGENRLVPSDVPLADAARVRSETLPLAEITAALTPADGPMILIIDGARPLAAGAAPGVAPGLAGFDPPRGGFVAMSAAPGTLVHDAPQVGPGPFAAALAAGILQAGLSPSDVMVRVRADVEIATVGRQLPWDQSSLRVPFQFQRDIPATTGIGSAEIDPTTLATVAETTLVGPAPPAPDPVVPGPVGQGPLVDVTAMTALPAPQPAPFDPARRPNADAAPGVTAGATGAVPAPPADTAPEPAAAPGPAPGTPPVPDDLAVAIQQELSRLGCYRQGIDGDWGPGSRRALERYYDVSGKPQPEVLDPTADIWQSLTAEPDGLCPAPVAAPPRPRADPPARQRPTQQRRETARPAPAPAPAPRKPTCKFLVVAIVCS